MKKAVCMVLILALCLGILGCSQKTERAGKRKSDKPDLYDAGLEVITLMQEKADSSEYLSLMGASEDMMNLIQDFAAIKVKRPIAVYEMELPKTEELLGEMDSISIRDYEAMSPQLREDIDRRMASAMATHFLAQQGNLCIAASSMLASSCKNMDLELENPRYYLYLYESGMTVMVTFGYAAASGTIVTLGSEELQEAIEDQCEIYGIRLKEVK